MTIVGDTFMFIGGAVFLLVIAGYLGIPIPLFRHRRKSDEEREWDRNYRRIMNPARHRNEPESAYQYLQQEETDDYSSGLIWKPKNRAISRRLPDLAENRKTKLETVELDGKIFITPK